MRELNNIVYYDRDEDRQLEVQFFPDALFFSVVISVKDGVKAESFMLTSIEARHLAQDILEIIPDQSILDANLDAI